jgi:hypothetical protein
LTEEWKNVVNKNTYLLVMKIAINPYKKLLVFTNSSGWSSSLIFRRSQIQISDQRLAVLTEAFHGFPQSLQASAK